MPQSILPFILGRSVGGLSTLDGKIVDDKGVEVTLKGFALSGFESSFTISGDPTSGSNSIAHDWRTNMYRYIHAGVLAHCLHTETVSM